MIGKLKYEVGNKVYYIDLSSPIFIGIELNFNGRQANHFGADKATIQPVKSGEFVGDVNQGGSCNVSEIKFIPHCNGTHTECVGHITEEKFHVHELLKDSLIPATLLSIEPRRATETDETYIPNKQEHDYLICKKDLEVIETFESWQVQSLIIRTRPKDDEDNKYKTYHEKNQHPFFSTEAMNYLVVKNIQHLLVDMPSIDKMFDEGMLNNHRIYWEQNRCGHKKIEKSSSKTITEMTYVSNKIKDGLYFLNLQIPAFMDDAAPCRPILYPMERL